VGATEDTVARLAAADGLVFTRSASLPWLTNKGHLGRAAAEALSADVVEQLRTIFTALGGDETLLAGKRAGSNPRIDLLLADRGLAVEVDEIQHFTADRRRTLEHYGPATGALFDIDGYRSLIDRWQLTGDGYRASKPTKDFPHVGGRRAQRAYFDAFRDLAGPTFGLRVLRVPAPECDGQLAYTRLTAALAATL
jgi:hypothetical protein